MTSSQNASKKPKRKHGAAGSTVKYYPPPNGLFWRRWLANKRQPRPRNSRATCNRLASFVQPRPARPKARPNMQPQQTNNQQPRQRRATRGAAGANTTSQHATRGAGCNRAKARRGCSNQPASQVYFYSFYYQQSKNLQL